MASAAQINAIADIILAAFNQDATAFTAYLTRAALETQVRKLESDRRKLQAAFDGTSAAHQAAIVENAAAQQALQAQIDALQV